MAKVIRNLRDEQKEFYKIFSGLCEAKSSWQVWADFVECAAIGISNAANHVSKDSEEREARYQRIMQTYHEKERLLFPKLLAIMVNAMEIRPDQDFLGEMFMALELGNHWKGQFFTPYDVCKAMAAMQIGGAEESVKRRGWVGVNDPACGAGALLIAARNEFVEKGIGYRQMLFVAQDIDHVAGLMCYIQLSLLGCAGYVVIADGLCDPLTGTSLLLPQIKPSQDFWFTPMFYDEVWQGRIRWEYAMRAIDLMAHEPATVVATPAVVEVVSAPTADIVKEPRQVEGRRAVPEPEDSGDGQLTLF